MKQHHNLHKTYEKYRNSLRLASYKLRRQEFIEKLINDAPDYLDAKEGEYELECNGEVLPPDYQAWLDSIPTLTQDEMDNMPNILRDQAF